MDNLETDHSSDNGIEEIVVVKVGTTTLTRGQPQINNDVVDDLARQIVAIMDGVPDGKKRGVILVSSGAMAMGRHKLGRHKLTNGTSNGTGETMVTKQMLAAIGQPQLMHLYQQAFATTHGILTAQALLAYHDFSTQTQRINARNTLLGLLQQRIMPVVNENDVVATQEIKFGDNDKLSALVANLVEAKLLVILSDIDGLYTANPHFHPEASLLTEVKNIDEKILAMAGGSHSKQGTGGMLSKVRAAQLASRAGICTMLINGEEPDALVRAVAGESLGTRFQASFIPKMS